MRNEVIGIVSVFGIVLLLFILRQLILTIGRENGQRLVAPAHTIDASKNSNRDDARLLLMPELDQADSSNGLFDELAKRRAQAKARGSNQPR